jgi:hypothetical protein
LKGSAFESPSSLISASTFVAEITGANGTGAGCGTGALRNSFAPGAVARCLPFDGSTLTVELDRDRADSWTKGIMIKRAESR